MLEDIAQCSEVLMIRQTSVNDHKNPYLRPENEVDLSSLAPPSDQDESLPFPACPGGVRVKAARRQAMWMLASCLRRLLLPGKHLQWLRTIVCLQAHANSVGVWQSVSAELGYTGTAMLGVYIKIACSCASPSTHVI